MRSNIQNFFEKSVLFRHDSAFKQLTYCYLQWRSSCLCFYVFGWLIDFNRMELRCGLCFAPHVDHLQSSRIEGQSGFMRCACNEHGSGL